MQYVMTFRSLHIDESVEMVKPVLEITLQRHEIVDPSTKKQKPKGPEVFYKLKLFGKLNTKARGQYYRWDLFESQFENYTGSQKL
jgi:hypothetical protein